MRSAQAILRARIVGHNNWLTSELVIFFRTVPKGGIVHRDDWLRLPVEKITSIYSTLYPYQKEKLLSDLENCMILDNASRSYSIKVCPKCGSKTPNWTRGGRANSGKQMLVCHSCNHRTVVDYGQLMYYSQQDRSKWDQLIKDTFQQVPN